MNLTINQQFMCEKAAVGSNNKWTKGDKDESTQEKLNKLPLSLTYMVDFNLLLRQGTSCRCNLLMNKRYKKLCHKINSSKSRL